MTPTQFAKIVLEAQGIQERSWVKKHKRYKLDHFTAAIRACEKAGVDGRWVGAVQLLNALAWNDAQYWAKEVLR
jgi:hypothetical protein